MSVKPTAGVETVGRIISAVATNGPQKVADLCLPLGLPRSTAFEVVRKLVDAELLVRGSGGRLVLGPVAIRIAFANQGLLPLADPSFPILRWLSEVTGEPVRLRPERASEPLLAIPHNYSAPAGIVSAIYGASGDVVARLEVGNADLSAGMRQRISPLVARACQECGRHLHNMPTV